MAAFISLPECEPKIRFYKRRNDAGKPGTHVGTGASACAAEPQLGNVRISLCSGTKQQRRQGRPPAAREIPELFVLIHCLAEFGSSCEFGYFAGRDLDHSAGLRIAPVAGFSL